MRVSFFEGQHSDGSKIPKKFDVPRSMIIKVQTPIASTEMDPMAMAYNKDRTFSVFMPITPELRKEMHGTPKQYFYAHYDRKNNKTMLDGKAEWQDW